MKRFASGFVTGIILTSIVFLTMGAAVVRWETKTVAYREGLKVTVNGEQVAFDLEPMILNPGWILCQLEPVVKKMGWVVKWDDASSTLKIGDDYDKYDDEAYVWLVDLWLSDWRESASAVVAAIQKFEKSTSDKTLVASLLDALEVMWINSDRLLGIKPTPKYKDTHTYLVQAVNYRQLKQTACA